MALESAGHATWKRILISRWVTVPLNAWHQPVVGDENWAVVSFQTALAEELIEERPDPNDSKMTRQRRYLDERKTN